MFLEPVLILELVVLGLCTGFLAGLLGIGGGMIMVPFITIILSNRGVVPDLAVKMAIATSMATIIFTSLSSVRAHHKRGAVRWDIVKLLAPGIVIGAAIASLGVFSLLKGASLALVFAGFVSFSATQMLLNKKPKPSRTLPGTAGTLGAGSGGRCPPENQVMRWMLAAISAGSNTRFQSSFISTGLPNSMALLQASENTPGVSSKITAPSTFMWPSRKSRAASLATPRRTHSSMASRMTTSSEAQTVSERPGSSSAICSTVTRCERMTGAQITLAISSPSA